MYFRGVSSLLAGSNSALRMSARSFASGKQPVKVAVTGAAGQIGYALLPRIASGEMLGKDQPVILQLLERTDALKALRGVEMELNDGAYPLLKGIVCTDSAEHAFEDIDYALLVGAKPRGPGMERADLLKDNGAIFVGQGKALDKTAKKSVKVVVVGNPANTNCLVAAANAPSIDPRNFSAMTRLDHNRALAQLALKTGFGVEEFQDFAIWGNHSPTMYPDITRTTVQGKSVSSLVDQQWVVSDFIPTIQQRGKAIIDARGLSSAMSAASSAIDHIHDWALSSQGWTSMAVWAEGNYGQKDLYTSFPVLCSNNDYKVVTGLQLDAFSAEKIEASIKELKAERDAVSSLL